MTTQAKCLVQHSSAFQIFRKDEAGTLPERHPSSMASRAFIFAPNRSRKRLLAVESRTRFKVNHRLAQVAVDGQNWDGTRANHGFGDTAQQQALHSAPSMRADHTR